MCHLSLFDEYAKYSTGWLPSLSDLNWCASMNSTHSLLHGNLNPIHTSTLYAYFIYYPTPWPFLLGSVLLSIALGFIGLQSSVKSWRPMSKKAKRMIHHGVPQMETNELNPTSEQPILFDYRKRGIFSVLNSLERPDRNLSRKQRREFLAERRRFIIEDCQRAALAEYRAAGIPFNPQHDQRADGGLGKATLIRTIAGIAWTTIRAASIFALALRITRGSNDTYPGIVSVVILFCSAQTYLATRAVPRGVYLLVVLDLMVIYAALILMVYGLFSQKDAYGKIGVQGGECPWFLGDDACSSQSFRQNGCVYNSTWDIAVHGYPPASPGSNSDPNPNIYNSHGPYHLPEVEIYVGLAGALYGILVMLVSLGFIHHTAQSWRDFWRPFPAIKMASEGRLFYSGNKLAFGVMLLLAIVTMVVHLLDELHSRKFVYTDSFGPNIYSLGSQGILQANGSSWSDCFIVDTPVEKWGSISAWWQVKESRAVRLLAGIWIQ